MKNKFSVILFVVICLSFGENLNAQFTFSVSPGLQLNGASFGYRIKNIVVYGGLQAIGGTYTETETGKNFDDNGNLQDFSQKYQVKENLFIPCIGTKFFFKDAGKLKMYGNVVFAYFIPSVKISDSEDPSANSDLHDQYSKYHLFGGQLGFGTEYFFDNNFSIGGEFGLTMLDGEYEEKHDYYAYNPVSGESVRTDRFYEYKINFTPTYIKISFNFYFNGKKEE